MQVENGVGIGEVEWGIAGLAFHPKVDMNFAQSEQSPHRPPSIWSNT